MKNVTCKPGLSYNTTFIIRAFFLVSHCSIHLTGRSSEGSLYFLTRWFLNEFITICTERRMLRNRLRLFAYDTHPPNLPTHPSTHKINHNVSLDYH